MWCKLGSLSTIKFRLDLFWFRLGSASSFDTSMKFRCEFNSIWEPGTSARLAFSYHLQALQLFEIWGT